MGKQVIALNVKHKDRINSYPTEVSPDPYFDAEIEEAEIIDIETPADEEADIGFGEDDTDEFGE